MVVLPTPARLAMASMESFWTVVSSSSSTVAWRIAERLSSLLEAMGWYRCETERRPLLDSIRYDATRLHGEASLMKLGRIRRDSPDGKVLRLVAAHTGEGRVVDLATAEQARLRRAGATPAAARRVASALFPSSMSAAIAAGPAFL